MTVEIRTYPATAPDVLPPPPSWHTHASCAGMPGDLFIPDDNTGYHDLDKARRICAACPVRSECLTTALEDPTLLGVWGGTTFEDRRRLRKTKGGGRRGGWTSTHSRARLRPHGSDAAVRRHYRRGEPLCSACLDGEARRRGNRASRRRSA